MTAKERPILFNAPMVRALLDGSKTQTRRILKQATGPSLSVDIDGETAVAELSWLYGDGPGHDVNESIQYVPCPYGKPGDRLWVREAHYLTDDGDDQFVVYAANTGDVADHLRALENLSADFPVAVKAAHKRLRPSIHMPRWGSRISLEITGVRVERLRDISEADARAEGARECDPVSGREVLLAGPSQRGSFALHYRQIWQSINGPDSWAANPWVWVVEFKVITTTKGES